MWYRSHSIFNHTGEIYICGNNLYGELGSQIKGETISHNFNNIMHVSCGDYFTGFIKHEYG